jgi:AhpC/TSA family
MVLSTANICAFGWKARDLSLQGVDGKTYSLADVRGPKGTLVVFICNHCPYVKASIQRIVAEAKALREIGIGTIAIMPNDTDAYPQDSFENMKAFSARHGFNFPWGCPSPPAPALQDPRQTVFGAKPLMLRALAAHSSVLGSAWEAAGAISVASPSDCQLSAPFNARITAR